MLKGTIAIIGGGDIECSLCPSKREPKLRDGVAVEIDGAEAHFCWRHLQAVVNLKRIAKEKEVSVGRQDGRAEAGV